MSDRDLSLVITSYSAARLLDLDDLLRSLAPQLDDGTELVFVAEKSRELAGGVERIAERERIAIRCVYVPESLGMSRARNVGIEHVSGDLVAFLDDDVVVAPGWIETVRRAFHESKVAAVTGPAIPLWMDGKAGWLPNELSWVIGCTSWRDRGDLRDVRNVLGMNMAFRKDALNLAGGFSPSLGAMQGNRLHGEEVDLSLRVRSLTRKQIVFVPGMQVFHKVYARRLSAGWVAKTSYWIGFTRPILADLARTYDLQEGFLDTERALLSRILFRVIPRAIQNLPNSPKASLRALHITVLALISMAIGYLRGMLFAKGWGTRPGASAGHLC